MPVRVARAFAVHDGSPLGSAYLGVKLTGRPPLYETFVSIYETLVDRDVEDRTINPGPRTIEMPPLTGVHGQPAVVHGVPQPGPVRLRIGADTLGCECRCPRGKV